MTPTYLLNELCALVDMPIRTVRYYVQQGLVERPQGETRAARYGQKHLDQLLLIKKWTAAGLSLERIRELLAGQETEVPARSKRRGMLEVVSRLHIADGVELVIEPSRAGLTPEQVRELSQGVMALFDAIEAQTKTPQA
ncbi:MAG: helix-turn-helix domain-containing protein [Giesbergeria sp.]|uniref:helix-turn-helix domain-containing protein n=1 Tax=Giesbergeria sp. TaxID=2818473 RepID=UPI0026243118|nr:helix-turn-helix domain-containing protein [Giesbergeria sp.]MDD2610980.1 helix-turn-helix domain-containing protein [Giesbergeria sp.]